MAITEKIVVDVDVNRQGDLDKLEKGLEGVGKKSKTSSNSLAQLRKEMKDAKSDMARATEGTKEYNDALRRSGEAAAKMKAINEQSRMAMMDYGNVMKYATGSVSALAGGFSAAAGIDRKSVV